MSFEDFTEGLYDEWHKFKGLKSIKDWVSVDLALPWRESDLLVAVEGEDMALIGRFVDGEWNVGGHGDFDYHPDDPVVTHWMPIPETPY